MNIIGTKPRRAASGLTLVAFLGLTSVAARAEDASVTAVRPQGVVVDASQLEDLKRGAKVGFVRDGDAREEIGQGWVLDIKDGKALVGVQPGSGVRKGDLVVVCPREGEDRHAEVRAKLEELGDAGPAPKGRKPSAAERVARQAREAMEARDAAVEEGKCDLAALDEEIDALAGELSRVIASRAPARREASRPGGKVPARPNPVEEEEASEPEDAAEESTAAAPPGPQKGESAAGDEPSAPAPRDKAAPTLQTALDAVMKLIESSAQKSSRRDRRRAEPASPPAESPVEEEEEPPSETPAPAPVSTSPKEPTPPPSSTASTPPASSTASAPGPAPAPGAVTDPPRPERRSDRWSRRGGRGQDRTATEPTKDGAATTPAPQTPTTASSEPTSPTAPGAMTDPVRPHRRGDRADRVRGGRTEDPTSPRPSRDAREPSGASPRDSSDGAHTDRVGKTTETKPSEPKQSDRTVKAPASATKITPAPSSDTRPPDKTTRIPAQPDKIAKLPAETKQPDKAAKPPAPASEPMRTATITGRVVSDKGQPLAGARVAIAGGSPGATTSGQGTFEIKNLSPGAHKLVVSMPGFTEETRAVTVAAGKSESVTVSLKTSANRAGTTAAGTKPKKFGADADD